VPPDFRVTDASLYMIDKVSHWFQTYKHSAGSHIWEDFIVAVSREFEVNTHHVKAMELLNLRQTGTVEEYNDKFDQLMYHILFYDNSISETMLVSQFLLGLKDDLRHSVEMHLPSSVAQVATLVAVQEHLQEKPKYYQKMTGTLKTDSKVQFGGNELWKARQLKEYRRLHNLCFKCGEKYAPNHTCATHVSALNAIQSTTSDGDLICLMIP
jgi:hypothetical protein